jgi:anthranilate phosphoribosyltransferase
MAELKGADPAYNAGRLRTVLEGARDPYRDVVLLNAAAAFIVAGRADTLKLGADLAAREIDSGRAKATLEKLISVSNG